MPGMVIQDVKHDVFREAFTFWLEWHPVLSFFVPHFYISSLTNTEGHQAVIL